MAANALFGNMGEFDPKQEQWTQYSERLSHFYTANGIKDDEASRKKAILLTVIGPTAYRLMRNLIAPSTVEETSYQDLLEAMKKHYDPQPSEIVQRFKFNTCSRHRTVSTFVAELRSLAEFCNFGTKRDNMLRDRLVCGINNEATQRRLLSEDKLTFKKALEIAQTQEMATTNARTLQKGNVATEEGTSETVHEVSPRRPTTRQQGNTGCSLCGKPNHSRSEYRFKEARCHNCGKIGHIKSLCRSARRVRGQMSRNTPETVQHVQELPEEKDEHENKEYELFQLSAGDRKPFQIEMQVEGKQLPMEIDTGASLSLV